MGAYRAFDVSKSPGRFLVGHGDVVASFNRIELTNLREGDNGWIVIRYRYHPAWESETEVRRFEIPEDPAGFIALQHPPNNLVLKFNAWAMFQRSWPTTPARLIALQQITAAPR